MALSSVMGVLRRLSRLAPLEATDDGLLLTAFIERREPEAFESLVQRHGPMVLGVCQRILGHAQDAEDAFQAVFLVLARKAESVRPREMVGNWLYGVAYRTSLQARASATRRRSREMHVDSFPEPSVTPRDAWQDLQPVLDEELNRLPDHYRSAVVLCELEGRPRADAARLLGIPEGTLSSRLAAARKLLADRLTRRGLALPAAGLATLMSTNAVSAVPAPLIGSVVQAAFASSLPHAASAGFVSANAVTLANGVMKSMFLSKLKIASAWFLGLGLVAGGVGMTLADGPKPNAEKPGAKPNAERPGAKPNAERPGAKPNAEGGSKPAGARDGEKPPANSGGRGEAITIEGTISKQDAKKKRDDGSEVTVSSFVLTDSDGNKLQLPAPRVNEAGKVLDSFNLSDYVGQSVVATGRGWTVKSGEGSTTPGRVAKVLSLAEVKAK